MLKGNSVTDAKLGLGLHLLVLNLVPPVGRVLLRQAVLIPTLAGETLETRIVESFALCQTCKIALVAIAKTTATLDLKKQDLFFNNNVLIRAHRPILQRPFHIDEFDMNSWHSVCAGVS